MFSVQLYSFIFPHNMIKPETFFNEQERLKVLESYAILDTASESDYDNLTLIASQICGTPVALITFVDEKRQWFKSNIGLEQSESPRDYSFCAYAIQKPDEVFVIPDARNDFRFKDNPLVGGVPNIVFYAGVPLVTDDGFPLGTICVIDHKPKILTPEQMQSLQALSQQAMKLLELRLHKMELEKILVTLEQKNQELNRFAYTAAHDLKSPLANILGLSDLFIDNYQDTIDDDGIEIISLIKSSSTKLKEMIDNLLTYSTSDAAKNASYSEVSVVVLEKELSDLFIFKDNCKIIVTSNVASIFTNKTVLEQVLINLVTNAIKYNNKKSTTIKIDITAQPEFYKIKVQDNGPGILKEHQEVIFDLFEIVAPADRFGVKGSGIGLATVKKIVENLGGTIQVESEMGKGTMFTFTLARAI